MLDPVYWLQYVNIFPVALSICIIACLLAMEGAVLFTPAFLFLFPALSPTFPRLNVNQAIAISLIVEFVGYSSSALGYWQQRRVDMRAAQTMLLISVPTAIVLGLVSSAVPAQALLLLFGLVLFGLAFLIFHTHREGDTVMANPEPQDASPAGFGDLCRRHLTDRSGRKYIYHYCQGWPDRLVAGAGGAFVGLIGVGIGEVTSTLLMVRHRLPIHVATATSAFVVAITVLSAASIHAYTALLSHVGLPWNLVAVMATAVLVGGQIAPRLSMYFSPQLLRRAMIVMFFFVGSTVIFRVLA